MHESEVNVARKFVAAINARDVDAIVALLSPEFVMIDSLGNKSPREQMPSAWKQYFGMVPDYWIRVHEEIVDGRRVFLFGQAVGTYVALGLLSARTTNGRPKRCSGPLSSAGNWPNGEFGRTMSPSARKCARHLLASQNVLAICPLRRAAACAADVSLQFRAGEHRVRIQAASARFPAPQFLP